MNSISFHPLLNTLNKPLIISSQIPFKFNIFTHVKTSHNNSTGPRNINITTKASVTAAPENETLYDLLGIYENVTLSEIKQAYKKMALKYHPDVSPPDRVEEYTVRFIRIQEAYETLSDPEARSMYDSCMAKGFAFSGKRATRFDPTYDDKKRWKETWTGQISRLHRRKKVNPNRVDRAKGMSWAARIRKQRSESCVNGSDRTQ